MRGTFEEWLGDVRTEDSKRNHLQYADDTVVLAASKKEPTFIMIRIMVVNEIYGLQLNQNKTNDNNG